MEQELTAHTVAQGAGCEVAKIADWSFRGLLKAQPAAGGTRINGPHRLYTFFDLAQATVAVALMREFFISPRTAFNMAVAYAHASDAPAGYAGGGQACDPERLPGLPWHYREGTTFMVARGAPPSIELAPDGAPALDDAALGIMVLNLTMLFQQTCTRLDHDWRQVLDEAYEEA